jgi:hypothetical protein
MNYLVRSTAAAPKMRAWTVNRPVEEAPRPQTSNVVTRRIDIEWLSQDGQADSRTAIAPAMPIFEDAFSAFAQGTLIQTNDGYVAIEDLKPGMMIATANGKSQPLLWIGSMTLFPSSANLGLEPSHIYRMTDGGFGLDRSAPDLILGPSARLLPCMLAIDSTSPLKNIDDLADGQSVIKIRPFSAIRVFHICLPSHGLVRANGVLTETYHPGEDAQMHLSTELFAHFMSLFPHINRVGDFGPLNHRRH